MTHIKTSYLTTSIEALDAMTTAELKEVAQALTAETMDANTPKPRAKKARLKLDQINIIIAKRASENDKQAQQVENSIKGTLEALQADKQETSVVYEINEELLLEVPDMTKEVLQEILDQLEVPYTKRTTVKKLRELVSESISIALTFPEDAEEQEEADEQGAEEKGELDVEDLEELPKELLYVTNATRPQLKEFAKEKGIKVPATAKADKMREIILKALTSSEDDAPPATPATPAKDKQSIKNDLDEVKKLKAQLAKLEQENNTLKGELLPDVIYTSNKEKVLVRTTFSSLEEVQAHLVEKPFQLFLVVHEGIDDNATNFLVTYANKNIISVVDRTRQIDEVLVFAQKDVKETTLVIDKRFCPYAYYVMQDAE